MLDRSRVRDHAPYRDWSGGLFMTALCASVAAGLGFKAMQLVGVFPHPPLEHICRAFQALLGTAAGREYVDWLGLHPIRSTAYFTIPAIAAIAAGSLAWTWFGRMHPGFKHLRGRKLLAGDAALKAAQRALNKLVQGDGLGLTLFPGVNLSAPKLLQSIAICGAQGGGKTVLLNNGLQSAIALNHKMVVFDPTKGDFSRWLPMSGDALMLISLTDSRSLHWFLGFDVRDVHDARAFAAGLIPESQDPLWSNAARMIVVTVIMSLIAERGDDWSWPELAERSSLEIEELQALAQAHYAPAAAILNPESKTSQSIMINQAAFSEPLHLIAAQVSRISGKRISLTRWLENDNVKHRRIVVQMNQRAASASSALSRALVELLTQRIASLEFSESKTRRLGFWLDEIPQFGRLGCISKLMEVGRSKGVYTVFGFQDYAQIEQIYGKEEARKWMALFGIKAFPQVQGMASQKFVSDEIGMAEVQYRQQSVSGTGAGSANISNSWGAPTQRPVILPSELALYGKRPDGIEALFIGIGNDCLALKIPFPKCPDIRPAHVPWPQPAARADRPGTAPATPAPAVTQDTQHLPPAPTAIEDAGAEEAKQEAVADWQFPDELDNPQPPPVTREREGVDAEIAEEVAVNVVAEGLEEAVGIPSFLTEFISEISGEGSGQTPSKEPRKRRSKKSLEAAGIAR